MTKDELQSSKYMCNFSIQDPALQKRLASNDRSQTPAAAELVELDSTWYVHTGKSTNESIQMKLRSTLFPLLTCMCCFSASLLLGGTPTAYRNRHCCTQWANPQSEHFPGQSWCLFWREERGRMQMSSLIFGISEK